MGHWGQKHRRSNALGKIDPSGTDEENQGRGSGPSSTRRGKPSETSAGNRINDIEMYASNNNLRTSNGNKAVRSNTSAHNKIFLEVYHLCFLTLIVPASMTIVAVNQQFKDEFKTGGYSHVLLCLLDLAPRISFSVLFPVAVYFCNPEMQDYICGLFKCQRPFSNK